MPKRRAPVASERVRREWARRVEAEYRSAAITQHLVLWLIQLGLSPTLIEAGLRIVKDELAHARLSHRALVAAGEAAVQPIARESLAIKDLRPTDPLELRAARAAVETFCLGETVAVPLFAALRKGCIAPAAKKALDRVLVDEVRHRDFGWDLLDHLLEQPYSAPIRDLVTRELPRMLRSIAAGYAPEGAERLDAIDARDRGWGLMPASEYARIFERAIGRDYAPRFAKRGFDVKTAWADARADIGAAPRA
ncbi:MAG TPA: ferritin-like domain-containing protein [Polyangiaceae bacterium]|nr:ferritin-like domain-containing protein [Polyangiaceae bacterium]